MRTLRKQDPERTFFHAAAWYLYYTFAAIHGGMPPFLTITRRHERRTEMQNQLDQLRSFRRNMKDPNYYRAQFKYLKPTETGLMIRMPAPVDIEVYQMTGDRWEGFYLTPCGARAGRIEGIRGKDRTDAQRQIRAMFEKQTRAWEAYDSITRKPVPAEPKPAGEPEAGDQAPAEEPLDLA